MLRSRALLLLLILSLASTALPAPLVNAQQPVILRLGLLTAADSSAGRGAQLAIAEINGAGGIPGPNGAVYAFELLSVPVTTPDEVRAGLGALQGRDVFALLGPDDNAVVLASFNELRAQQRPILTAATGDTITIADTSDYVFRSRAPEQVYMQAVVRYLVRTVPQPSVVLVQNDPEGLMVDSVRSFSSALGNQGVSPLSTLQLDDAANLDSLVANLQGLNAGVLAVWGAPEVAADLLHRLRGIGWSGLYIYREAADPVFRAAIQDKLGVSIGQVWGVSNWLPGVRSALSDAFLRQYATTFGVVPDGSSAAYYDAVYLIAAAISEAGGDPAAVRQSLQTMGAQDGVQGVLNPSKFFVGETVNTATVFELNAYAVPQVLGVYVDGALALNEGADTVTPFGTPVPTPILATATPVPTATPEGVYAIVTSARLNIRSGPSTNYDVLGQFSAGDTIFPIGANLDYTWLVVPFRGTNGWIATYLVDLRGDRNTLPIIVPPPTPTPAATPTASPVPYADLVIASASVQPVMPRSGQPFSVRAVVRNQGGVASGQTALAATFQPGGVYSSSDIPPLAPGQAVEVVLSQTVSGAGTFTVELVADLNNLVNEGPAEGNNLYPITYTLDHAVLAAGSFSLNAPLQEHDILASGTANLRWDGANLAAVNGAQIAVLPGLTWNTLNYGQLGGVAGLSVPRASLPVGAIVGVVTAPEGYRGALRIDGYSGDTILYTYRIYAP